MRTSLDFDIHSAWRLPLSSSELAAAVEAMWEEYGRLAGLAWKENNFSPPDDVLELALVDEAEMARLNREFLNCDGPTNILAFPAAAAGEPAHCPAGGYLGWLALSPETLKREAFLYKQDLLRHLLRLVAHGLGHLLGYEHGPAMDAASNQAALAAQRVLLFKLGSPAAKDTESV